MTNTLKRVILGIIVFLVLGIIAHDQLSNKKFQTTPLPGSAFHDAQQKGEPIFIEFYAKW